MIRCLPFQARLTCTALGLCLTKHQPTQEGWEGLSFCMFLLGRELFLEILQLVFSVMKEAGSEHKLKLGKSRAKTGWVPRLSTGKKGGVEAWWVGSRGSPMWTNRLGSHLPDMGRGKEVGGRMGLEGKSSNCPGPSAYLNSLFSM